MRIDRKTGAAAIGVAGLLGLGLYVAVPAAAKPASSPSPSTSASPKAKERHGGFRARHGMRGGHGVHGTATVRRDGRFVQVTWQNGQVTARSGTSVTVRSADGASWTWTTDGDTKVRKKGTKAGGAKVEIANGDQVMVWGRQDGATRTAKIVRVRA
ncbi:DUF5666 domain-containing protein [Spirillospora sp. NPDC047279]|uniref:DUF5666 domain-containing protein n=1 Tax=Spirillospora sp. NPDC047279 TaxID=3155478 RepID=UPI0034022B4B